MSAQAERLRTAISDRYLIERELGQGGMATVYLAEDLRHHRKVAIKVLLPELSAVLGPERFLKEIEVTAQLQHPNILPLFDSGVADGLLYYVMPYVDGESLRDRLNREQQLTIGDATRIAADIAGALEYAHKRGVIHRDIKPENILLQDGRPVVADFGIALAVSAAGGNRVTQTGMSLGTPQYMSPEQATGDRQIDARSDIYSLGAVTYEMLTGDPPHTGSTTQSIIAKVITEKPTPIHTIRSTVPPQVEFAVDRALAKLPADRWSSAREFADAIEGRLSFAASPSTTSHNRIGIVPWAIAVIAVAALAFVWLRRPATPAAAPVRFTIESVGDERAQILTAAISPDGQTIAISTVTGDSTALWIKRLDELTPHRLAGSDGAYDPFFSPDGKHVGFLSTDGKVRTLSVEGGSPSVVGTMGNPIGVVWATPDTIVAGMIAFSNVPGLTQLSSGNSHLVELTKPVDGMHHFPILAPDGKSILFSRTRRGGADLGIASLDGKYDSIAIPSSAVHVPVGVFENTLVYLRMGRLWSVPIDLARRKVTGRPVDLGEEPNDIAYLSRNGTLLYTSNKSADAAILLRPGKETTDTLTINSDAGLVWPRWSPDGRSISFAGFGRERGIYVLDRDSRAMTRLETGHPGMDPTWTPNDSRIVISDSKGNAVVRSRDGSTVPEPLVAAPPNGHIIHCAVARDGTTIAMEVEISGRYYVYSSRKGGAPSDAKLLAENARHPEWGPDGKWIVYQSVSDNPGRIVAHGYPGGGTVQISEDAGSHPSWRGSTVYYETGQNIMAATVQPSGNGLTVTGRRILWRGKSASTRGDSEFANYDVASNGDLIVLETTSIGRNKVVVELNWTAGLAKKH